MPKFSNPMTTRPLRNSLAGIALLLQVFAAFGATRGLVLCVGPAEHVAVEDHQAALRCRGFENGLGTEALTVSSVLRASPTCVDTPLLGAYPEKSTPSVRAAAASVAVGPVAELPRLAVLAGGIGWKCELAPPTIRILRHVVLLI